MKKMFSFSTAMILFGISLGGNLTLAADSDIEPDHKDVKVTYDNRNVIVDPTDPANPEYVISIPAAVTFTEENKTVDTSVSMTNPDGSKYESEKKAEVTIKSASDFKLANEDADDEIEYRLVTIDKDGKGQFLTNENNVISVFSKDLTTIKSEARLIGSASKSDIYKDTLTYTVADASDNTEPEEPVGP